MTTMIDCQISEHRIHGDEQQLCRKAADGDANALGQLLDHYSRRLSRMVHLRLTPDLQRRVDESDILQEAFVDAAAQITTYVPSPDCPFYFWLRNIVNCRLAEAYRRHMGAQKRDVTRDISISLAAGPDASCGTLAIQLVGSLTSPSQAAIRQELVTLVRQGIDEMKATDREVLVLRHYEELTLSEIGTLLGISRVAAGKRYLKALTRLREITAAVRELTAHSAENQ